MSKKHDMIVTLIAGHLQRKGFVIKFMEGNHSNVTMKKPEMPPKVKRHRPDVYALKGDAIGIGETKTEGDLKSEHTKNQLLDFKEVVRENTNNVLVMGIPSNAKIELIKLMRQLRITLDEQIIVIEVPETFL